MCTHLRGVVTPSILSLLDDEEDERIREKVAVNVEEYRMMGDPSFRKHFHLTKPTLETQVSTPDTFRSVALRFGVCTGIVHEYYAYITEALRELGQFLIDVVQGPFEIGHIKWPNVVQRQRIKASCERSSGFPGVVGIIDVCHVPISAPLEEPEAYRDYKNQYSISVQAVYDERYLITALERLAASMMPE
ncbi:Protein ANTAGONIST OF LIKE HETEROCHROMATIN PROTEIN 1 [Frankliniella fusca]|uniref:Protein ANTAGONIST OF LIKE HETEROCHROMATIN PROTEIN 1 n=1 Tax=Frankliniella fusca TaxID=407009 RepID=A0AAE1HMH1_9NEOP|nr:Protein ANTAGONIST OF LIKE HETEROCHROMATIN PROTEIN 1 [Frankliniella fusca]